MQTYGSMHKQTWAHTTGILNRTHAIDLLYIENPEINM